MKNVYLWLTGVLAGVLIVLGIYAHTQNKRSTEQINALNDSIELLIALRPEVIYETSWHDTIIYRTRWEKGDPYPVVDTFYIESQQCRLNYYSDTIRFDDLDLSYDISTIGTLEGLEFSYRNKRPDVINIPTSLPCPPAYDWRKDRRWSAELMLGFPASGYVGAGYRVLQNMDITAGVHSSFTTPQKSDVLVGVRVGL